MTSDFSEGLPPPGEPRSPVRQDELDDLDPEIAAVTAGPGEERVVAIAVHWGGFLTWILVPLILYLTQSDRRSLAAWHSREAFNFQASLTIYYMLPWALVCLVFIDVSLVPVAIGVPVLITLLVGLYEFIIVVWASIAGARGQRCRIPLNIAFIRRPRDIADADGHDHRDYLS